MTRKIVPELATLVHEVDFGRLTAEVVEKVKLHALDSIGNALAGSWTMEGRSTIAALFRLLPQSMKETPLEDASFLGAATCAAAPLS